MKALIYGAAIVTLIFQTGCCFKIFGEVIVGCDDGGGIPPLQTNGCNSVTGIPMRKDLVTKCCTVENGPSLNPGCYDGQQIQLGTACKDWFLAQEKIAKVDQETGNPPNGCPGHPAASPEADTQSGGDIVFEASRQLDIARQGESEAGGVEQDQTPESEAAIAGNGLELGEDPELPKLEDDINLPPLNLGGSGGPSGQGPANSSSGGYAGLGNEQGVRGNHSRSAEAATELSEDTQNATYSSGGSSIVAKKSKGNSEKLFGKLFGKQGSKDGAGVKGASELLFGDSVKRSIAASEDPNDYFSRIHVLNNLFKVVEKRYRSETLKWKGL